MHAFELRKKADQFFSDLEDSTAFLSAVESFAQLAESMKPYLAEIAEGGQSINQAAAKLHNHLVNANRLTKKSNNRQFFRSLEHFQRSISLLDEFPAQEVGIGSQIRTEVEAFAQLYDSFLSTPSGSNALPLALSAQQLQFKLQILIKFLEALRIGFTTEDMPFSSERSLTLWLPSNFDLGDFAERLAAMQSIYSEICMLLSVSEVDNPLRISKIESGSLWAKVFGESKVIALMAGFIEQTASWMYRAYTTEGKISAIPRKVEAVDAMIGLSTRLKEAGIDASPLKPNIAKAAVAISRDLATLLEGQPSVTINEATVSLNSEFEKLLLARVPPLRLESFGTDEGPSTRALPPPDDETH